MTPDCKRPISIRPIATLILLSTLLFTGCATNPVTGKRELGLVSEQQERQIGEQNYAPSIQMQGGEYMVDRDLSVYVNSVGQRVAAESDRPLDYEFVVLNNSIPNAWALPGGKIAINRGLLLEMQTEAELAAVLGHEVVHAAARHGAKGVERGMLLQGAVLATAVASRDSDYSQYVVGGAAVAAQLVNQRYGRKAELESDFYGMKYMSQAGYNPQGAVELQKTFMRLSEGRRQDWLSGLFASHPPSEERVNANIVTAAELPSGGDNGRESYQQATAYLRQKKPAYDAFDKARKALSENKPDSSETLIRQAIDAEPAEAHFFGFRGDLAFARENYQAATRHYTDAVRLNDNYFKFYLGRGESYRNLNRMDLAQRDLEKSMELLPTADAATSLGKIAERQGRVDQAMQYFASASQSKTPAGQYAMRRMVTLDLPNNPQKYLHASRGVDQVGRIYIELQNRTPVNIDGIEVGLVYTDSAGQQRSERHVHNNMIAAGQRSLIMLQGQQYATAFNTIRVGVISARVSNRQ